ncbi:MAG: hypothetical protein KF773_10430 [Deltaproteobacteria bacterium]|nr:hypothetical protein [Deltaproteobacteria bacterium]
MTRRAAACAVVCAIACGGKQRPPPAPKPEPIDPAKLAAQLHGDLVMLRDIARRQKADCAALVTELRAHVAVMRAHKDVVDRATADAELAVRLRAELDGYGESTRGLAGEIGTDLAAAWQACAVKQEELRAVIDQIPEM